MNANVDAKQLRTVIVGCTRLARSVVSLAEEISTVVGVVNLHPDLSPSRTDYDPLIDFSLRRGHDMHLTRDINSAETVDWLNSHEHDVLIQCGWSQIFERGPLSAARRFPIGIHPSPLPIGRGAAVVNWKLIEGGGAWGNSLFVMEPRTDTGDVLDFEPFEIEARDDIRTAQFKIRRTALKMLRRTLPRIADGSHIRRVQDPVQATRYLRRAPRDGEMQFSWHAKKAQNYVRALTRPYSGAFVNTGFGLLTVWECAPGDRTLGVEPGTVLEVVQGRGVRVSMGEGSSLWFTLVTPPGDTECWMDEWALETGLGGGTILSAGTPKNSPR